MKTTAKKLPKSQILLTVELDDGEWKKYRTQAFKKLSAEVNIPGFRKGHIPEKILLEKLGEPAIVSETIELALPQSYMQAVQKENIRPLSQPDVKVTATQPFTFEATIPVMPEVTVRELKKLSARKEKITVTEKEIDEMVEYFRTQVAERKEVDRPTKKGDVATIDFQGFDTDGVSLEGTQGKNHPVEIGSNTMIPGFEDELSGLKKSEKKSFPLAFPKDYRVKRFAGKKVRFDVTVHKVEETILPTVDEEFVAKVTGQKKPVQELRKEIEESLIQRKETEQRQAHEEALLNAVERATIAEIPAVLIDDEVEYLLDNLKMQGLQRGITWENQLLHFKKSEDELKKELQPQAEKQVRIRLGIQKFLQQDNITADEEEVQENVSATLGRMNEEDRKRQEKLFEKGARGWQEAENRVKVAKWINRKLEELVK